MSDREALQQLVGREEEWAQLAALWSQACQGKGFTLFVSGEAGMGKSTLIDAFLRSIDDSQQPSSGFLRKQAPEVQIARGDCSEQFGREEAFLPFAEALAYLIQTEAREASTAEKLRNVIYDSAPAWMGLIPIVGDAVGGMMETAKAVRQHFGEGAAEVTAPSQQRMLQEYTNTLLALARRGTIALFLDDLHWADSATVALLGHLARRIHDHPILIIGTYRPSDLAVAGHPLQTLRHELARYKVCSEMRLATFAMSGFEAMLERELPGHNLPDPFRRRLYRHTGGVPLYISETLAYLRESGRLVEQAAGWRIEGDLDTMDLPGSVQAVIDKRLERLDEGRRRMLQYAAVEGDPFHSIVLAALLEADELEVEEALEDVEKTHRLIRFEDEVELGDELASRYHFSHALFQEALLRGLRGKRLRLLHRRVAQSLETLYEKDPLPIAHQLAYHFEQGALPAQALTYSLQAARHRLRLYAWEEAALAFARVQRLAPAAEDPDAVALSVAEGLGDIALGRAQYAEAITHYEAGLEALDLALIEDEEEVRARLHRKRARVFALQGEFAAGFEAIAAGLKVAPEASLERAALHLMEAGMHYRQGRYDRVLALSRQALALPGLPKVHELRAHANSLIGLASTYGGQIDQAFKPLNLAYKIYARLNHLPGQCDASSNLAAAYHERAAPGDWEQALQYDEQALALAERINDRDRLARTHADLGWTSFCLGDIDRAIHAYNYSLSVWSESGADLMVAFVRSNLGAAELSRGRAAAALPHLQAALAPLAAAGIRGQRLETLRSMALAHAELGDFTAAGEALAQAREGAGESGTDLALVDRTGGIVAVRAGRYAEARRLLTASLDVLEGAGDAYEEALTALALAQTLDHMGESAAAEALRGPAMAALTGLGVTRLPAYLMEQDLLGTRAAGSDRP